MIERRQFTAHALEVIEIEHCCYYALPIGCASEHSAPRVDDHRIAVVRKAMNIRTELARCDQIDLIFDRARADQNFPVGFSSRKSERARDRDDRSTVRSQLAIKLGKSQVVADAQPDGSKGCLH